MKRLAAVLLLLTGAAAAALAAKAQTAEIPLAAGPNSGVTPKTTPAPKVLASRVTVAAPVAPDAGAAPAAPTAPAGPMTLMLRGLDKITGRPTDIIAPVGKPVKFATLTITARYCYSTPASETPETAAFVQIQDHRPDQNERHIFSGWMYASSPGLNAMEHPLYDVWVINCRGGAAAQPAVIAATAPTKVLSPDSSDKEGMQALPEGAGQ